MTVTNRRDAARRKLLNILPRALLEQLSEIECPGRATKTELVKSATANWNAAAVREAIAAILKSAD